MIKLNRKNSNLITENMNEYILNKEHDEDILSVSDAEKIIGKRPNVTKPQPPSSNNPKPETLQKYNDALESYEESLVELEEWESNYDILFDLSNKLIETKNILDGLKNTLKDWGRLNIGIYIIRNNKDKDRYSYIQNLESIVGSVKDDLDLPTKIKSLDDKTDWYLDRLDDVFVEENNTVFPSVLLKIKDDIDYTLISIPEDINIISDSIEEYMDSIQPKDIKRMINVTLDHQSDVVLNSWVRNNVTNSTLPDDEKELKLYISSVAFMKEIENLNKYPQFSSIGDLVNDFLDSEI